MSTARPIVLLLAMATCLLAACSRPKPPVDAPPEPQATELRDAMQAPLDKAKGAEEAVQAGADRQRAAIDATGG